jgi:hypothetical protein
MPVMQGRALARVAVLAAFLVAGSAWAEPSPSARVRVRGPGAARVEKAVARVLTSHGYRVMRGRGKGVVALRVSGRVRRSGKRHLVARLTARAEGEVVGRLRVRAASRRALLGKIENELGPTIERALARQDGEDRDDRRASEDIVAEAEPVATEAAPDADAVASAAPVAPRRRVRVAAAWARPTSSADVTASVPDPAEREAAPWIRIAVGPELYGRRFTYRDDIFEQLREYDVLATPAVTATATVYPIGPSRGGLAGFGLSGRFTHVPSFDSEDGAGGRYTSEARSFSAGARYRLIVAGIELAAALDAGSQSFSIAPRGDMAQPEFPAVDYRYLRAGLDLSIPLWSRYALAAAVGYRHILASGEIESAEYFPRSTARGFDAELELSAALLWGFDLRAGAALERYGHDLDPVPGDAKVAGGALDQYPRLYLRLGFAH